MPSKTRPRPGNGQKTPPDPVVYDPHGVRLYPGMFVRVRSEGGSQHYGQAKLVKLHSKRSTVSPWRHKGTERVDNKHIYAWKAKNALAEAAGQASPKESEGPAEGPADPSWAQSVPDASPFHEPPHTEPHAEPADPAGAERAAGRQADREPEPVPEPVTEATAKSTTEAITEAMTEAMTQPPSETESTNGATGVNGAAGVASAAEGPPRPHLKLARDDDTPPRPPESGEPGEPGGLEGVLKVLEDLEGRVHLESQKCLQEIRDIDADILAGLQLRNDAVKKLRAFRDRFAEYRKGHLIPGAPPISEVKSAVDDALELEKDAASPASGDAGDAGEAGDGKTSGESAAVSPDQLRRSSTRRRGQGKTYPFSREQYQKLHRMAVDAMLKRLRSQPGQWIRSRELADHVRAVDMGDKITIGNITDYTVRPAVLLAPKVDAGEIEMRGSRSAARYRYVD